MAKKKCFWPLYRAFLTRLPAQYAIQFEFRRCFSKWANLQHPHTFSEKIQYRKLHGDHSTFAMLSDKIVAKDYVREMLGEEFVIPTLWAGSELPALDKRTWALPFVIKANFTSGCNYFVKSNKDMNWDIIERITSKWMCRPYHTYLGEKWYNMIERRLLVEPFVGENLNDYKFYVFHGHVHFIHVDTDRFTNHKRCFYDRNWQRLDLTLKFPLEVTDVSRPQHLQYMIAAAERLAANLDFVRVDLYDHDSGPKFGEMTFAPGSGYERFSPGDYDGLFGSLWEQPARKI